jgi:hypothetical protein
MAKQIIKLFNRVGEVVNNDPVSILQNFLQP